jgi:hypothetical protein
MMLAKHVKKSTNAGQTNQEINQCSFGLVHFFSSSSLICLLVQTSEVERGGTWLLQWLVVFFLHLHPTSFSSSSQSQL